LDVLLCYIHIMNGYGQFCAIARTHEVLGGR
jgi:hypothetical protein